ncbi:hypothetical protein SNE40_000700 [Patella caerulea]|uniref:Chitin-binding type-2 domain-containing protein n=1 Tax=Patella caerulea TaxID=87958 RepID=A0AAN8KCS2_PATCE
MQVIIRQVFILNIQVLMSVLGTDNFCQGRTGQYYPYMANCSKYYQCAAGVTYIKDCGADTQWNQAERTCGWVCNQSHPELEADSVAETTASTTESQITITEAITSMVITGVISTTIELDTTTAKAEITPTESHITTSESVTTTTAVTTTFEQQTNTNAPKDVPSWACGKKVLVPNEDRDLDCPVITEITVLTRIHCLNECVVRDTCTCVSFKKDVSSSNCSLRHCAGQTYNSTPSSNTVAICL